MQKEEQEYLHEFIGNQIKKLRKKSRFSQEQLAKKLGLSRVSVVNIERGRQHPSLHLLVEIARILNVKISSFINDEMFKDFDNNAKLNKIKKQISKANYDGDKDKIIEFIKQTINQS